MKQSHSLATQLREAWAELNRQRTIADFLNYGFLSFGPYKKKTFFRVGTKSLIETEFATLRYIAVIDVFIFLGLFLGLIGNPLGWPLFIFSFVLAIVVFIDLREIERRAYMVKKTIQPPLKKVQRVLQKKLAKYG